MEIQGVEELKWSHLTLWWLKRELTNSKRPQGVDGWSGEGLEAQAGQQKGVETAFMTRQ